jgi:hypothetical protein
LDARFPIDENSIPFLDFSIIKVEKLISEDVDHLNRASLRSADAVPVNDNPVSSS